MAQSQQMGAAKGSMTNARYQARASQSRRLESVRDKSLQLASGHLIAKRLR